MRVQVEKFCKGVVMPDSGKLVSTESFSRSGWSQRKIDATFDEPDGHGPSEHWLSKQGSPLYDAERVSIAEYRVGISDTRPETALWLMWSTSSSPTAFPALTLDFHGLADAFQRGIASQLWSLRLSHPFAGRLHGTSEKEKQILESLLETLWKVAFPDDVFDDLFSSLDRLAAQTNSDGADPWNQPLCLRKARRKSYLSKARSPRAVRKVMQGFALIHTGKICDPAGDKLELLDLLVATPCMRFDFLDLDACRGPFTRR